MTRKNADNQPTELIAALAFLNPNIEYEDIMNIRYPVKNLIILKDEFDKYKKNFLSSKDINYNKRFLFNLKNSNIIEDIEGIDKVYLVGKKSLKIYPEIYNLNNNLNKSDSKADIYLSFNNKSVIGVSIKKDKNCPKTNLGIENRLPDSLKLKNMRQRLLQEKGINELNYKLKRKNANKIFHNRGNSYFSELKEQIRKHNVDLIKEIVYSLYSINNQIPLYEYNGINMNKITFNIELLSKCKLQENESFYKTKNGKIRQAAKLFYLLEINEYTKYKVEIRWKGNIWKDSPQFLTFEI